MLLSAHFLKVMVGARRSLASSWLILASNPRRSSSSGGVIPRSVGTKGLCGFASAAWGMMFKFGYIGNFEQGYIAMGYIIIASSVFTIFMRIKGQSSVLCGDQ